MEVIEADGENYKMESYTYKLESRYGGPEADKKPVAVKSVEVVDDGKAVHLVLEELQAVTFTNSRWRTRLPKTEPSCSIRRRIILLSGFRTSGRPSASLEQFVWPPHRVRSS